VKLDERVLTVREAAELLRVSKGSYYAAAARGELPAVRIGRRLVVPGAALQRLLEGGERPEAGADDAA
jgi:excisionase family DNA binding protein